MTSDEAQQLAKFRRAIAHADAAQLLPIIGDLIDNLIDLVRGIGTTSGIGVEMLAAVSAELHRRRVRTVYAPVVGNC